MYLQYYNLKIKEWIRLGQKVSVWSSQQQERVGSLGKKQLNRYIN